jgi:hypothetical protein
MDINLHIERLVLDGVDIASGQNDLLQVSVTNELSQLFDSRGLSSQLTAGVAVKQLSTNSIHLDNTQPIDLGRQIAQSIYGGIGHE